MDGGAESSSQNEEPAVAHNSVNADQTANQPLELSEPLAFLMIQIMEDKPPKLFNELGGYIADKLQKSIVAFKETVNSSWRNRGTEFTGMKNQQQAPNAFSNQSGIIGRMDQLLQEEVVAASDNEQQRADESKDTEQQQQSMESAENSLSSAVDYANCDIANACGFGNFLFGNSGFGEGPNVPSSSSFGLFAKKQIKKCKINTKWEANDGSTGTTNMQQKPQIYNYAPNCQITSSSAIASHLQVLIAANTSHRRSRYPNWTYNFPAHQQWLDITLTLPHPIMLNEIVIKPHPSSLLCAPSAVQVELSSDPLSLSWSQIPSLVRTLGCSRISISTTSYRNPVNSVRLYLKKPLESNSVGLVQIQLNGSNQVSGLENQQTPKLLLNNLHRWLTIFHQVAISPTPKYSSKSCNPPLPSLPSNVLSVITEQMVQLYLGSPAYPGDKVLQLIYKLLLDIDREQAKCASAVSDDKPKSVVQLVIDQIRNGVVMQLDQQANIQLAELLFTMCTISTNKTNNITNIIHQSEHRLHVCERQRELLHGIVLILLELMDPNTNVPVAQQQDKNLTEMEWKFDFSIEKMTKRDAKWGVFSLLMWAAACALWRNTEPESAQRKDSIALCKEIAEKIMSPLVKLSLLQNENNLLSSILQTSLAEGVQKSSCWLLCAIIRAVPHSLDHLFDLYGLQNSCQISNPTLFFSLGRICQSRQALEKLQTNGYLESWLHDVVRICERGRLHDDLNQLLCRVECIEQLSVMFTVCKVLSESAHGIPFFRQLMHLLVSSQQTHQPPMGFVDGSNLVTMTDKLNKLRVLFISLARRCLTYGGAHRVRIAECLCDLLRLNEHNVEMASSSLDHQYAPSGILNEFMLQMLHQIALDDEVVKVHFTNIVQPGMRRDVLIPHHESSKKMAHPVFGCQMDDCVIELSLYTKFTELVPVPPTILKGKTKSTPKLPKSALSFGSYSAADQWLKSHGFVPPAENLSETATAVITPDNEMDEDLDISSPWTSTPPSIPSHHFPMHKYAKGFYQSKALERIMDAGVQKKMDIQLVDVITGNVLTGTQTLEELLKQKLTRAENDDHQMLCLTMRYAGNGVGNDAQVANIKENNVPGQDEQNPEEVSTLEHFARAGGLYELSKHTYLYRQSLTRLLDYCESLSSEISSRQQRLRTTIGQQTAGAAAFGAVGVPIGPQMPPPPPPPPPPGMSIYDDFEFVDELPPISLFGPPGTIMPPVSSAAGYGIPVPVSISIPVELVSAELPPGGQWQWQWGPGWSVGANVGFGPPPPPIGPSASKKARTGGVHFQVDQMLQNSAHIITSLGLFLRLNHYAELMIKLDRLKAKRLLRLALDIRTVEISVIDQVSAMRPRVDPTSKDNLGSNKPRSTQYYPPRPTRSYFQGSTSTNPPIQYSMAQYSNSRRQIKTEQAGEQEELMLFPFIVLARLFNDFNPGAVGMQRSLDIREQALRLGIVDVLLISLAHFSHQPQRFEQLRGLPNENEHGEFMVQMIRHMFNAVSHLEQLRQTINTIQQNVDFISSFGGSVGAMASATAASSSNATETTSSAQSGTGVSVFNVASSGSSAVDTSAVTLASSGFSSLPKLPPVGYSSVGKLHFSENSQLNDGSNVSETGSSLSKSTTAFPSASQAAQIFYGATGGPADNEHTTNDANYWAKGTGFGRGTTQQQWNLSQHVAKKRQDENISASLLNILIAYIRPSSTPPTAPKSLSNANQPKGSLMGIEREESEGGSQEDSGGSSAAMDLMLPLFAINSSSSPSTPTTNEIFEATTTDSRPSGNVIMEENKAEKQPQFVAKQTPAREEDGPRIELTEEFVELLYRSCAGSTVNSHLLNDSVLDISKRVFIFESIVSLVTSLAQNPPVRISNPTKFEMAIDEGKQFFDVFDILLANLGSVSARKLAQSELLARLKNLGRNIDIYLKKLHTGQNPTAGIGFQPQQQQTTSQQTIGQYKKRHKQKAWCRTAGTSVQSEMEDEEVGRLHELVLSACSSIETKMESIAAAEEQERMELDCQQQQLASSVAGPSSSSALDSLKTQLADLEASYCAALKDLQFESVPFYETSGDTLRVPFRYSSSLTIDARSATMNKRTRRLAQEIVTLSNSLPLSASSSVFVRTSEERLDAMKVLITGPADTPYANGCFEFDVFFPPTYPNTPMQMNLETTGNCTVRFNPNLYDDGKVCLSILNTWRGRPEERWNAETSSLLQVLVSIQSLILVQDPYFNEPGYERWRNTPAGQQASREYDANIRQMCVRWAMIEQIKNPPVAFADVILRHFWMKRDEICDQVEGWIAELEKSNVNNASKTMPDYLTGLKKHYESLKDEFSKMSPPKGIENFESKRFPRAQIDDSTSTPGLIKQ